MMHYYNYGTGSGFDAVNVVGAFLHFIFWFIVIMIIIRFLRHRKGGDWHGLTHHVRSPLDIVKERYAKGEINKEEYEEKKKDLM